MSLIHKLNSNRYNLAANHSFRFRSSRFLFVQKAHRCQGCTVAYQLVWLVNVSNTLCTGAASLCSVPDWSKHINIASILAIKTIAVLTLSFH